MVDPADVLKSITPQTVLISVMTANNETGVIQPTQSISKIAGTRGILFHAGAVQSFGKIAVHIDEPRVDLMILAALRDFFEQQVMERIERVKINGRDAPRVPNTSSMSFASVDGESVLLHLDLKGICASTGSACATGSAQPSHVMRAMGLSPIEAQSTVRFSLGRDTTREDLEFTIRVLQETVERLRGISSIA